jgi:hypothetical protein
MSHLIWKGVLLAATLILSAPTSVRGALIAHWTFDEPGDTDPALDLVGGRNAVLRGAAARGDGPAGFGRALLVNGTVGTYADVGYHAALSLAGTSYTVAWWVNANAFSINNGSRRMINMDNGMENNGGYSFAIFNGSTLGMQHGNAGNSNTVFSVPGATISVGSWTHFAVTYEAATRIRRVYRNGLLITSATLTGHITNRGSDPLLFGAMPVFNQNFSGLLDDIQLYNDALSATAIQAIMDPGLVVGDVDGDGDVDLDDFWILRENFLVGTTRAQGDLNGDSRVDLRDFVILKDKFPFPQPGAPNAAALAHYLSVPEPSAPALSAAGIVLMLLFIRRRARGICQQRGLAT